ncbi:hypothetical protein N7456_003012 [Penicillium angulare]|uniref:ABC transporter domain-containing protein n=1 Tax=Penicillium angulare TaxID=116970 RepID=A0A9W9KIC9_9EURO|nr:hypothetical protein N7456_003012 [Penicillium angulare]
MGDIQLQEFGSESQLSRTPEPCIIRADNICMSLNKPPRGWITHLVDKWPKLKSKKNSEEIENVMILNHISVPIRKGCLTAILGGSGSGKTSLLSVLAGRAQPNRISVTGHVSSFSLSTAYLAQHEVLPGALTVKETLRYAADLRRPRDTPAERDAVVQHLLHRLNLTSCANTRLGDERKKGCSGGERRRTSIGIQLLSNADVLFCDEPTTGLDAATAHQVVRVLKRLVEEGLTVVMSIHAPRSDMWPEFDDLILLARGSVLFSGQRDEALPHFSRCGFDIPQFVNPAEYLIDLAALDTRTDESQQESTNRLDRLEFHWNNSHHTYQRRSEKSEASEIPILGSNLQLHHSKRASGLTRQVMILTSRNLKMFWRDRNALAGVWGGALAMAVINGWVFWKMDGSLSGIRSREGSLWNATELYGYLILVNDLYRMNLDIRLFDHESQDGITTPAGFLLSRRAAKLILEDLPIPLIFTIIYYFLAGYRESARQFFVFLVMMFLTHLNAVSFATLSTAISRHFLVSGLLGNIYFTMQMVASGYFVPSNQMPPYVGWLRWLTHTFYTFSALCTNEFIGEKDPSGPGQFYDCPYSDDPTNPSCKQYTGSHVMDSLGLPHNWIWQPALILCAIASMIYIGAGVLMHFNPPKPETIAGSKTSRAERIDTLDISRSNPIPSAQAVTISLRDYELSRQGGTRGSQSSLLGPISTVFHPGRLVAVMGASGSGKTTLLSVLSGRLASSTKSRYHTTGSILYNGECASDDEIRKFASFVHQDDIHLLPSLTVRATLRFVAHMTLPNSISDDEKNARAEATIRRFGLRHCADTVIGNNIVKGLSGGEKRRVSIACTILKMPEVVILDEPTSGLDTFTALSVIEILEGLAMEGRTVVFSVHQPTARMLRRFSDILVLGPKGMPVYAGSSDDMVSHFSRLGFNCPLTTNVGDFVMDLATSHIDNTEDQQRLSHLTKHAKDSVDNIYELSNPFDSAVELQGTSSDLWDGVQSSNAPQISFSKPSSNPFFKSFRLVIQRSTTNICSQPFLLLARSLQLPGMAILMALFFAPLEKDFLAIQSRVGFAQQYACLSFMGMIQNMATYPNERDVFYREASEGMYGAECFILQYTLLELPLELISCTIFAIFTSYVAQLNPTAGQFGISLLASFACLNCGESISIIFNTLFTHTGAAISATCALLGIFTVLGGVISLNVPPVLRAFNHISPPRYAIGAILNYSMHGLKFTCDDKQRGSDGSCPIQTGEDVLKIYNMADELRQDLIALCICILAYRLAAYCSVKARSSGPRLAKNALSMARRS